MPILGLDIGGANIKAALASGQTCCLPFPLWKDPSALTEFLASEVLSKFPRPAHVAVTMTGELCDCFENKADGVKQILDSVQKTGFDPMVYTFDGSFVDSADARKRPLDVAASNWHALANFSRRMLDPNHSMDSGMLLDLGSTSCDLIRFSSDRVLSVGRTDLTRLLNQELVYTGVSRTPVCAVANRIRFRGQMIPVAEELFATMQDVYVVLGDKEERPDSRETADGRSLTIANSQRRLARMLCSDPEELRAGEILEIANAIRDAQLTLIQEAFTLQVDRGSVDPLVVVSGSGSFLASRLLQKLNVTRTVSLAEHLGPSISESSPAYAVATLLQESIAGEE